MAPTICLAELSSVADDNGNSGIRRSSSCYVRRRQRNNGSNRNLKNSNNSNKNNGVIRNEEQKIEIRRMFNYSRDFDRVDSLSPPASPVWEPTYPAANSFLTTRNSNSVPNSNLNSNPNNNAAVLDTRNSENLNCSQRWRSILARREGLLDIVARTMALVRRSHILQKRVNALRYETREFVRSVLNNPENNNGVSNNKDLPDYDITRGTIPSGYVSSSSSSEILSSRPITPPPTPDSSTEYMIVIDEDENENNKELMNNASSNGSPDNKIDYNSSMDDNKLSYSNTCNRNVTQDPMVSSS